jgi:hypothetical protein
MLHLTPKASGYFENMWLWVADHMIERVHFPSLVYFFLVLITSFRSDPDLNDAYNNMVSLFIRANFLSFL